MIPFILAAAVTLLAAAVMYFAESALAANLARLEQRRITLIGDAVRANKKAKAIDLDALAPFLDGDLGQKETRYAASWLGELGAVFTGFVSLVAADIVLLRDADGQTAATVGCLMAFLLGAVVLTLVAVRDPQTKIWRLGEFLSGYQLTLLGLTILSGAMVFIE